MFTLTPSAWAISTVFKKDPQCGGNKGSLVGEKGGFYSPFSLLTITRLISVT